MQITRKLLKSGGNGVTDFGRLAEYNSLTAVVRFKHIQNILLLLDSHH
jgi:hypothetical protein